MHYVADDKAIRDSKNDLDDAEHDNKVADLKKQQDDLQKQLDIILETYDSQIESIEKQIDSLKQVKSAWSDIVDNQELKELEERLRSIFGDDVKDKILNGNTDFINSIISQYSDTSDMLRTIEDATLADIQNMVAQYGVLPENLMPVSGMITDIANTLGTVDTSGFNANLDSTAQSSSNAAAQIQGTANAINTLSNEVSNYQMPELNADNMTASLAEDGAILTALRGFTERFREICEEIPGIWNASLNEAFSAGGGNGDPLAGGLPADTKYEELFAPVFSALDECKSNLDARLKECLDTFRTFQTDLSGVIGTGGSTENPGTSQSSKGTAGKASCGSKPSSTGDSGTIVGAVKEGGALINEALNGEEGWSAAFVVAKDAIHDTTASIVDCIESMASEIAEACISAVNAINMLEQAESGSGNHPAPTPYIKTGHGHSETGNAHAEGTGVNGTTKAEKNAIVSEYGQREMTVFPNGKTILTNTPTAINMPKGTVVYNEEQTEKILKNKVAATGKAYADGTIKGNVGKKFVLADGTVLTPVPYDDPIFDVTRKFEAYMKKTGDNVDIIAQSGLIRYNNEMSELVKNVTNVNNVTNNNRNMQPVITQNITLECPNLTNNSGIEYVEKQLGHLSQRAMQEAYKR